MEEGWLLQVLWGPQEVQIAHGRCKLITLLSLKQELSELPTFPLVLDGGRGVLLLFLVPVLVVYRLRIRCWGLLCLDLLVKVKGAPAVADDL